MTRGTLGTWRRAGLMLGVATTAAFATPLRALADTSTQCPPTAVLPESPLASVMLLAGGAAALGAFGYLRRRRGLASTIVPTLLVVLVCGAMLSMILAAAATTDCGAVQGAVQGVAVGGGSDGPLTGVAAAAVANTPLTGADIPWITATVLIVSGLLATGVGLLRRRSTLS